MLISEVLEHARTLLGELQGRTVGTSIVWDQQWFKSARAKDKRLAWRVMKFIILNLPGGGRVSTPYLMEQISEGMMLRLEEGILTLEENSND
jgi:hypothetical protein